MKEATVERSKPPQTDMVPGTQIVRNYSRSGTVAGAISAFGFAFLHALFISDIWFSLPIMVVAGALCGLCVAWSYRLLVTTSSFGTWLRYNTVYVVLLALLAVVSVITFDPVTTMAALLSANGPPDDLIRQALPMTGIFTLLSAVTVSMLHKRGPLQFAAALLTCAVIVLFLGLNISTIGLVFIPRGSLFLVVEMFGLILAINIFYTVAFTALERKSLLHARRAGDGADVRTIAKNAT